MGVLWLLEDLCLHNKMVFNGRFGHNVIRSRGGFELIVDRLIPCCRFLLAFSVNSLLIVPLDVVCCTVHSLYLSLSDCIALIRQQGYLICRFLSAMIFCLLCHWAHEGYCLSLDHGSRGGPRPWGPAAFAS